MEQEYSLSLVALLKGIVYSHQKEVWENLIRYESDVKKYFLTIALDLYLDKSEGFAFLRQKERDEEETVRNEHLCPIGNRQQQLQLHTKSLQVLHHKSEP
jgi:hypothetical protein